MLSGRLTFATRTRQPEYDSKQQWLSVRVWPFQPPPPTKRGKKLDQIAGLQVQPPWSVFYFATDCLQQSWNASASQSCWRCIWLNVEFIPRLLPHTSVDITMANYQLSFQRHSLMEFFERSSCCSNPPCILAVHRQLPWALKFISEVFMHVGYAPGIKRNGNMAYIVCILETKPLLLQSLANISQSAFYSFTISKSYSFNVLTTFHQNSHSSLLYRER